MGLKGGVGGGQRDASVSDFDDEVGEFKAVEDGTCGGCHVTREPVDGSSAGVEVHLSQPFLQQPFQPRHSSFSSLLCTLPLFH